MEGSEKVRRSSPRASRRPRSFEFPVGSTHRVDTVGRSVSRGVAGASYIFAGASCIITGASRIITGASYIFAGASYIITDASHFVTPS